MGDSSSIPAPLSKRLSLQIPKSYSPPRSPTRSPREHTAVKELDPLLASLSPESTLEALQATEAVLTPEQLSKKDVLAKSIATVSETERAFAIKAAYAAKKTKEWIAELQRWHEIWKISEYHPPEDEEPVSPEEEVPDPLSPQSGSFELYGGSGYYGSLSTATLVEFEDELTCIDEDYENLDIEGIKSFILEAYTKPLSEGTYKHLDDFTAIITHTVLQALPSFQKLRSLLDVWTVRLRVLRQVPSFLRLISRAETVLLQVGDFPKKWEAASVPLETTIQTMQEMLPDVKSRVIGAGQKLDSMIDALEGKDSLPQMWIDRMDSAEENFQIYVDLVQSYSQKAAKGKIREPRPIPLNFSPDSKAQSSSYDLASPTKAPTTSKIVQSDVAQDDSSPTKSAGSDKFESSSTVSTPLSEPHHTSAIPVLDTLPEEESSSSVISATQNDIKVPTPIESVTPSSKPPNGTIPETNGLTDSPVSERNVSEVKVSIENQGSHTIEETEIPELNYKSPSPQLPNDDAPSAKQLEGERAGIEPSEEMATHEIDESTLVNVDKAPANTHIDSPVDDTMPTNIEPIAYDNDILADFTTAASPQMEPEIESEVHPQVLELDEDNLDQKANLEAKSLPVLATAPIAEHIDAKAEPEPSINDIGNDKTAHSKYKGSPILTIFPGADRFDASPSPSPTALHVQKLRNLPKIETRSDQTARKKWAGFAPISPLELKDDDTSPLPSPPQEDPPSHSSLEPLEDDFLVHSPVIKDKKVEEQLTAQISSMLNRIPAPIKLVSKPGALAHGPGSGTKPRSTSLHLKSARSTRPSTPLATLAPAETKPTRGHGDPAIKLYHLHQPGKDIPLKLHVRLVGETGERVMVRVGGGWADLETWLKDYALHHSRRTVSEGKFQVTDYSTPKASPANSVRAGSALSGRSTPSSELVMRTRKLSGAGGGIPQTPEPLPMVPRGIATPGSTGMTPPLRSSSRLSFNDEDAAPLGLAGPKNKNVALSPRKQAWVDGMMSQAKQASAEKKKFVLSDMGKVGSTRRVFSSKVFESPKEDQEN